MTIRDKIDEVVADLRNTGAPIFIAEMVLRELCEVDPVVIVKIDDVLIQNTPGAIKERERDQEYLKKLQEIK